MGADLFAENSALARDAADPSRRADFRVPPWPGGAAGSGPTSRATRSGLQPRAAAAAVEQELDVWAELAVEGWFEGADAMADRGRRAARVARRAWSGRTSRRWSR